MSTTVTGARPPGRIARTLALADAGLHWLAASADDEPRPPAAPPPSLRGPAWAGTLGSLLVSLSATHRGRYFPVQRPSEWPLHIPFLSSRGTAQQLVATAAFGLGTILVLGAWLSVVRRARAGRIPARRILAVFGLWVLPLLIAPPLFTRDTYAYAASGQLVSKGFDPYRFPPDTITLSTALTRLVHPVWRGTVSPYGPLFVRLAWLTTVAAGHQLAPTIVLFRVQSIAGVLLAAAFLPRLARRYGQDPGTVLALAVLNPLTVLHLVGGAHNDALMIGLLVAGVAVATSGRWTAGILLCTLATSVKLPAFGGVLFLGWAAAGPLAPLRQRLRSLARAVGISVATLVAISLVCALGWGWMTSINVPARADPLLAPADALGFAVARVAGLHVVPTTGVVRAVALAVVCAAAAFLVVRSERLGVARGLGWGLLAFAVFGPTLYPWYLTWGLFLVAASGLGALRRPILATSVLVCIAYGPDGQGLLETLRDPLRLACVLLLLVALAAFTVRIGRRLLGHARATLYSAPHAPAPASLDELS